MALDRSYQAHSDADHRILDDLSVIGTYPDSVAALHDYAHLHREAPERELYVLHTDREEPGITERRWIGIRKAT